MMKKKRENIMKRTMILVLVLTLVISALTGCGEATKVENESESHQTESGSVEVELETECEDHEWETVVEDETETEHMDSDQLEDETETEHMDSDQLENKTETERENNTEDTTENNTTNKTESDKQATNQSSPVKNNSTQNSSSNNSSSQTNKNQVGLGKDSYVNVTSSSNKTTKEEQLGKEIIKKIIKNGMSDFDKVKAINDYMIINVSYDSENYKNNTIPYESYTAFGAMEKKVAVCAGYARMFKILANCAGLEATYVTGDTPYGYHAWNQVKVDGKWYNIDVTWNDPDCETDTDGHYYCGCYQCFLLSNEDFNKRHTAFSKVYETGSSKDFEAYKQGCPYDGAAQYYKTQADFDKLVKEMIAANKTSIRILSDSRDKKDMVSSALKKQGIYGECEVNIKDEIRVYRETNEVIYKITIDISLDCSSYTEAKKQKITSVADAKKHLETSFKNYNLLKEGTEARVKLYVSSGCRNNKDFHAELYRWAQYEKKMHIFISAYVRQVDSDIYEIRVDFQPIGNSVVELIYSTKDMEPAIKRMLQYGYKKICLVIQPEDYMLTGNFTDAKIEFKNKFCKSLSEKYCLQFEASNVNVENNSIDISFESNGHDVEYCEWEIEKEATCVREGLEIKICRRCKKIGEQRAIPKDDNHSYYWDVNENENTRVHKCKSCSYVGIKEYRYGGVWGYFDEEAAMLKLNEINMQRAYTFHDVRDHKGNIIDSYYSPQLTVTKELTEYAKERLCVLNGCDFVVGITNEYAVKYVPYYNTTRREELNYTQGLYSEVYDKVGIICFMYDVNDDASRFLESYVMEFGLTDEYEALEQ